MQVSDSLNADVQSWLRRSIGKGAYLNSATRARGATSSSVYFIKSSTNGHSSECVLRLFTNEEWLRHEPDLAEHEATVLIEAQRAGLPTPRLIAYAADKSECGVPAVLMTFVQGSVELCPDDFEPWLFQLAERLAEIHSVSSKNLRWRYSSWTDKSDLKPPSWTKHTQLWERAIEIGLRPRPKVRQTFIHRDYHPTNVLWADGKLCAIVDWVNGCLGPASVDLAHCRINLAEMYGAHIAEKFLDAYKQVVGSGFMHHPYWDIDSLLDTLPEPEFYAPWQDFGLGQIEQDVLRDRIDEYLRVIMSGM